MKKLFIISLLVMSLIRGFSIDERPMSPLFKPLLTPSWYFYALDSSVWMYTGAQYELIKLVTNRHLVDKYVPYKNANKPVDLDTMSIRTGFVDFAQRENPYRGAYRLFVDTTAHTLGFYNDETDITLQIGQEMWTRVYNNSGSGKLNGTVVRITGSIGDIATIDLASNDYHIEADGVLGVLTHDVESNTFGFVTTIGEVHGLNTSMCPEGGIIYLGVDGQYTHTRPLAPNFVVEIGTCLYSDPVDGTILVNIKGSPYDIVHSSFNDIFIESMKFTVTSNGTTTIGTIERKGGGDLTMQFSDGFTTLDCTPAKTITLTAGTATVPQTNYVYALKSTKDIAASTSGWPSDEHIKIAEVACRTSALTQSDGVLRNQNWNDHIAADNGSGHVAHINERLRRLNADWYSGVTPTFTIVSTADPDNLYFSNTGGKVYQMHLQDFPAQAMPIADIHIVNHYTTPYATTTNLNTQLTDALGNTLTSKSYSLVIWGVQNESGELSHLMCNLPIGSYLSAVNAIKDADNYSVYTIPNQFRGVGFLIARVTLSHNPSNSGTWTLEQVQDLRGYFPNNTAGGGAAGSGGGVVSYLQLLDTPTSYAGASNKLQGVNSGETALEHKNVTATTAGTLNIPTGQQYQINGGSIIVDAINDGVTTTAPSQNAVYDALLLKAPSSGSANYIQASPLTPQSANIDITGNIKTNYVLVNNDQFFKAKNTGGSPINVVGLGADNNWYLGDGGVGGSINLVNNSGRILLNGSGNVSIGASYSPSYKLDVNGDVNISTGYNYKINGVNMLSGTTSYLSKFTGANTIGNSIIRESADSILIEGVLKPQTFITKDPYVDVRSFGAVGDGVTDDAVAVQNAIDHVESLGGGEVYFPNGTFLINSTINITSSNITLKASTSAFTNASKIVYTGTGVALDIGNETSEVYRITLENLLITASSNAITSASAHGIRVRNGRYLNVNNITIQGFESGFGISDANSGGNFGTSSIYYNCVISNCKFPMTINSNHIALIGGFFGSTSISGSIGLNIGQNAISTKVYAVDVESGETGILIEGDRTFLSSPRLEFNTNTHIYISNYAGWTSIVYPEFYDNITQITDNGSNTTWLNSTNIYGNLPTLKTDNVLMKNDGYLMGRNTGGSPINIIGIGADNNWYLGDSGVSGRFRILNNAGQISLNTDGTATISSLSDSNPHLTSSDVNGTLTKTANGSGLLVNNGSGTFSYWNTSVQTLIGTTPTWDISSGQNARISLTGNTTITLTNFSEGQSGSLTVINAATQYTLNIVQAGYVNAISKSIGTPGNYTKLNTTGASAVDKYSWYYDGYYMFWRGETDYIKP